MNGYIIVIGVMLCAIALLLIALCCLIGYAKHLEGFIKNSAPLDPVTPDYREWYKDV